MSDKKESPTVLPDHTELTIPQAADVLLVSPPFVAKLLDDGQIPFTGTGSDRRVMLRDALAWKRKVDADRLKSLEELSAIDQQLGLGY